MEGGWDPSEGISHILSLPCSTSTQGNLFLSGAYALSRPGTLPKFFITSVLTVLDKPTFRSLKLPYKLQSQQVTQHKWVDL